MSLLKRIGNTPGTPGAEAPQAAVRPAGHPRPDATKNSAKEDSQLDLKIRGQNQLLNQIDPKLDFSNVA